MSEAELTDDEKEKIASVYIKLHRDVQDASESGMGDLEGTKRTYTRAIAVLELYTGQLYEYTCMTEEMDMGVAVEHVYVSPREDLIQYILDRTEESDNYVRNTLTQMQGTKTEVRLDWFEHKWWQGSDSVKSLGELTNVVPAAASIQMTELGILTTVCVCPNASKRTEHQTDGIFVLYESGWETMPLREKCLIPTRKVTEEEKTEMMKEVREYFSDPEKMFLLSYCSDRT